MSKKIYLPEIEDQRPVLSPDESLADTLYRIIRDSRDQRRNKSMMMRHLFLDQAAQQKANDMVRLGYFAHTSPSDVSANQNVRNTGYRLPERYPLNGNNVESLYVGANNPQDVADTWLASDYHRFHVYGQDAFFRDQNCIGVGYALFPKEENCGYWVFISAPCIN